MKPISNKRNDEMRQLVCGLYLDGKGVKQIGCIIGRNHSLAYKWIKQAGLLRDSARKRNSWKAETQILQQYAAERKEANRIDRLWMRHWDQHVKVRRERKPRLTPEQRAQSARDAAKRRYSRLKNDPAFKAEKRKHLANWLSIPENAERARAGKRKSIKEWKKRPENRVALNQRRRFKDIIKSKNQLKTREMIGCSPVFLRNWLEARFKRGMSWDNYGTYWCIDHVIPCAKFDLSDPVEVKKCFHYSNLQPLTFPENTAKCDRVKPTQPELCMAI